MAAAPAPLRATQNGGGDGGSPVSPEGPLPAARSAPSPPRSRGAPSRVPGEPPRLPEGLPAGGGFPLVCLNSASGGKRVPTPGAIQTLCARGSVNKTRSKQRFLREVSREHPSRALEIRRKCGNTQTNMDYPNESHWSFDYHSKFRSSHGASWRKGHTASAIQGTCCQGQGCSEELILLLKENQDLMRMCLGLCSLQRALLREEETDDSEEEETPLLYLTVDPQLQQGPSLQSPTPTTPGEPGSSSSSHSRQQILSSSAIAGDLYTSPCC
ncbi:uncharacterized protein LOC113967864 isoform X1 [Neopelma chrysocephalum]|uniref:uncharacterized protein LOC113967864 isoform X1 n=1 Tax=Neopelma chrysocephalum TaxID=114329 RepID=UPI000FCCEB8D|nr:uncharacterized protein LOC113967864 isoform X1 [Neopelma chrysocephalum]